MTRRGVAKSGAERIAKLHLPRPHRTPLSDRVCIPLADSRLTPDIHPVVACHHAIYYLPIIPAPRRLRP